MEEEKMPLCKCFANRDDKTYLEMGLQLLRIEAESHRDAHQTDLQEALEKGENKSTHWDIERAERFISDYEENLKQLTDLFNRISMTPICKYVK